MPVQQRLLLIFVQHPQQVLSRQFLQQQLWSPPLQKPPNSAKALSLAVHRLRQIFASGPLGKDALKDVYGKGYCLDIPVQSIEDSASDSRQPAAACEAAAPGSSSAARQRLAQLYYLEAHDHWPRLDPCDLDRRHWLLQQCVAYDPTSTETSFELCYFSLLQCLWGVRSASRVLPEIQSFLATADTLPNPPPAWAAIRAETMTMLLWQPRISFRRYGTWLTRSLPAGPALYSWSRHLIFSGYPRLALRALKENVRDDLIQGWLMLSLTHAALGNLDAAIQAVHRQLRIDDCLVGSRLFLAMLLALRGNGDSAMRMVTSTGILDRPFQGSLALVCYSLAHGPMCHKAHLLLDEALALIKLDPDRVGGIAYWGLAALALERSVDAFYLLQLSVRCRCYSAPVLLAMPFVGPYSRVAAFCSFQEQMRTAFLVFSGDG